jgi:predicted esterase
MTLRRFLFAAATLTILLSGSAGALAASRCGPFGDPPAKVDRGFFADFVTDHSPVCFRGKLLGPWRDADGDERYACLYEPESASASAPLPMLIFLHGSMATADTILVTNLLKFRNRADLGEGRTGVIILAPEGRYTDHYYPSPDNRAVGWDNWYRQLNPAGDVTVSGTIYKENADAAAIDHFADEEIATGKVDRNRVYITGWSNGAAMAILYALDRPQMAAAAVYSAPNPFGAFDDPCQQTPVDHPPSGNKEIQVFNPHVPIMHVRNSCDIGGICPNGNELAGELRALKIDLDDVILDSSSNPVNACDSSCGTNTDGGGDVGFIGSSRGLKNHVFWPKSWTERMLDFLKAHPR